MQPRVVAVIKQLLSETDTDCKRRLLSSRLPTYLAELSPLLHGNFYIFRAPPECCSAEWPERTVWDMWKSEYENISGYALYVILLLKYQQ